MTLPAEHAVAASLHPEQVPEHRREQQRVLEAERRDGLHDRDLPDEAVQAE